jgi:hypothetical protein
MPVLRIGALICAVVLAVAGCSSDSQPSSSEPSASADGGSPADAATPVRGLPDGVDGNTLGTPGAGLSPDGRLWVVTYGSGSSPMAVGEVTAEGQTVDVPLSMGDGSATMDLVPSTSTIDLPDGVDPAETISVVLGELGIVSLDPPTPGQVVWAPAP